VEKTYQIAEKNESRSLAEFLVKNGQSLLPMVELIEQSQRAVDDLIDVVGRATIEAVLKLSAQGIAGPPHPGKKGGAVGWHGREKGTVCLRERKLRVERPRLRKKAEGEGGEVPLPAYEAMRAKGKLGSRMLEILLQGVSTRHYAGILPQMAETVGVSKSAVSRQAMEASEEELRSLCERRLEGLKLLILYVDGLRFGEQQVVVTVGVDEDGQKHVLGLASGASESETVVKGLLEDLVARGLKTGLKYLFVIDGSKALRAAIDAVFGSHNPVQRCRNHKLENVSGYLSKDLKGQVKTMMRAAFRLPEKDGMARLEKQAQWLEREYPSAAASLREGMTEMFTITRLGLSASLSRCLASTNVIESPHSGVRLRTRRVCRWRDGQMVLRWAASAVLATEKNFRRIMGHQDLWMLKAALGRSEESWKPKAEEEKAA
jgi:putative transposase